MIGWIYTKGSEGIFRSRFRDLVLSEQLGTRALLGIRFLKASCLSEQEALWLSIHDPSDFLLEDSLYRHSISPVVRKRSRIVPTFWPYPLESFSLE